MGTILLNDNTFSFFIEVEKNVRVLLPQHILRTDTSKDTFRSALLEEIARKDDVQFYWILLSHNIEDIKRSEALLTEVVNLSVTIRGFSMAASWLEEYKRLNQTTTTKATGLRKSISGSISLLIIIVKIALKKCIVPQ